MKNCWLYESFVGDVHVSIIPCKISCLFNYICKGPEFAAITRLAQTGIKTVNWVAVAADLQNDWREPTAQGTLNTFHKHLPFYSMLSNNQEVVKNDVLKKNSSSK